MGTKTDLKKALAIQKRMNLRKRETPKVYEHAPIQLRKGRTFIDPRLSDIDAKPKEKLEKKDRDYVKTAHTHLFAQNPEILHRIKDLRDLGAEHTPIGTMKFNPKLLDEEQRDELKKLERHLTNVKYFLLRKCDEALGDTRGGKQK